MSQCVISKAKLLELLDSFDILEPQGVSPYIGIYLEDGDNCHMYRSSVSGYVRTVSAPDVSNPKIPWVFPSYTHLRACIAVLPSETVRMWVPKPVGDSSPALYVGEVSDTYSSELRVSSTVFNRTGTKNHVIGSPKCTISRDWFAGYKYPTSFKPTAPPLLRESHLLLLSSEGGVRFTGLSPLVIDHSPRVPTLRAITENPGHEIVVTDAGYFVLTTDELEFSTIGHTVDTRVVSNFVGSKPVGSLSTDRLMVALYACSKLSDNNSVVRLDLKTGSISTEGEFGNPIRFSVDAGIDLITKISKKSANLIHDTLKNVPDKLIDVYINTNNNGSRTIILQSGSFAATTIIG